jgi:soluble lytic murein transglycosylase-like protein
MIERAPRLAALVLCAALLAAGAHAARAELAPDPAAAAEGAPVAAPAPDDRLAMVIARPPTRPAGQDASAAPSPENGRRCTGDGVHCITLANYVADVCRTIEAVARDNDLDTGFFARLLWKESLFDAAAISPAGAQGIAQFMPGTARLRGLKDAFNPAEALAASAFYLAELSRTYGNIGLAAVAYNGGEARAERFIAAKGGLPLETRAYVQAITGHSAEAWRDSPPASLDLALEKEAAFQDACIAQAANRSLREFRSTPALEPWGVVVAFNRDSTGAERQVARLQNRHGAVLAGEPVVYTRSRRPGMPGAFHYAQIGRKTRPEAEALCSRLRGAGGDCMVLRN